MLKSGLNMQTTIQYPYGDIWITGFAWHPVKLSSGQWTWLAPIQTRVYMLQIRLPNGQSWAEERWERRLRHGQYGRQKEYYDGSQHGNPDGRTEQRYHHPRDDRHQQRQ
jgi:hypothetical protein